MSDTLDYDAAEVAREEAIYRTPAVKDRRQRIRDLLALQSGEDVCSIGCGPGFEPSELADVVGTSGHVHGIDQSQPMLKSAATRCVDQPQVTLSAGDATDLPIGDERVDAATAIQVYEYVPDGEAAVAELARILRPGGRAVVCDTDFDSLVWRSTNRDRMQRVLETFTDHCEWPHLGSELASVFRESDLRVDRIEPYSICNTALDSDSFAHRLMEAHAAYLVDREKLAPEKVDAWVADLQERDAAGETFFSLTQYLYLVRKSNGTVTETPSRQ
jgi:ubiquinone/menaquinone biosynthesis C-methylase UbiE